LVCSNCRKIGELKKNNRKNFRSGRSFAGIKSSLLDTQVWSISGKIGRLNKQGSDTRVIPQKTRRVFLVNTRRKTQQKNPHQTIQFHFVMPVIINDFFMFTASNDQQVMSSQIFRKSKVLNKSLADELNQPTSFLTACSNKKSEKKTSKADPIKPKKPTWLGCF